MIEAMNQPDSYAALRHPGVTRFIVGRLFSSMASNILSVAVGWQLYERTGSAFALGMVGLVEVLPVLALALPAGIAADRLPRRKLAMAAHVALGLCALALAALTHLTGPVPLYYVVLFVVGVANAFRSPSVGTILPELVPPRDFANANTWASSTSELASMAGPALGGLLIALGETATPAFVAAATAHLFFVAVLSTLPRRPAAATGKAQGLADMLAGLRFVARTRVFLGAITLDLFAVLFGGAVALLPIFAKDILHVGPTGLGWLRAAPAIGAFLMAVVQLRLGPWQRPGRVLLLTVTGFGLATIGFGLSTHFALSFAMLFLCGVFDNVSVVIRATLEQTLTPDAMRGRVSAIHYVFIGMSNQLGSFESGTVALFFGAVFSAVSGGVGTLLVVLLVALAFPQLRGLAPLHTLKPLPMPGDEPRDGDGDEPGNGEVARTA
jgi:MFS family permease